MSKLKSWLRHASSELRGKLALHSKTSRAYIRHVAAGRKRGTAEFAAKIETATTKIHDKQRAATGQGKYSASLPEIILRGEIADVCAKCPYYKQCVGSK